MRIAVARRLGRGSLRAFREDGVGATSIASHLTASGSPIHTAIPFTAPLEDRNDLDKRGQLYEPL